MLRLWRSIRGNHKSVGLPEDVLLIIFSYLDLDSLKKVRLVSSDWKDLVETPLFWTRTQLKVSSSNHCVVLKSKLSYLVSGIRVPGYESDINVLFRAIHGATHLNLKTLDIRECNSAVSLVEPALLLALMRLETCDLAGCDLTIEQVTVLFTAIKDQSNLKLKNLNIRDNSAVSSLDPGLFQAIVRLEQCDLGGCSLNTDQLTVLLRAIQKATDLKLKTLHLYIAYNISSVEPGLLQALVRLEECGLRHCHLTGHQLTVLFRSIQDSADSKLRRLEIGLNSLAGVTPVNLVRALARLERVKLYFTNLTTVQLEEIFRLLARSVPNPTVESFNRKRNFFGYDLTYIHL